MNGESLAILFGLNHHVIQVNTKELTHEDSMVQPRPAGNCVNWVLGHLTATRNDIMQLLGEPVIWDAARAGRYIRGARPLVDPAEAVPLETILVDLARSQERLITALAQLSPEQLAECSDGRTLGEKLATYQFHEAYHAGQLGLLRRLVGRKGAIQ